MGNTCLHFNNNNNNNNYNNNNNNNNNNTNTNTNTNNIYLYRANSSIQFSNAPENCIVISTLSSRKSTTIIALTKIVF